MTKPYFELGETVWIPMFKQEGKIYAIYNKGQYYQINDRMYRADKIEKLRTF